MPDKKVSVVIPNYNGQSLLAKHLPQVINCLREGDEIIIVDDASTDDSVSWLEKYFKTKKWPGKINNQKVNLRIGQAQHVLKKIRVTILVNYRNLRFAKSCNRGVELAKNPLIFLLNSDVSPHSDVLQYLIPHFENKKMFAVGCHEIEKNKDGISGGKNKLWFEKGIFVHSRATNFSSGETAWASGGSAVFDKNKWLQLGGFDLNYYPAYWEDVDLSFRAKKKGWLVWFEAQAYVDHNHESTNSSVFHQLELENISWKNGQYFTRKNSNHWQKLIFRLWQPYWWWQRYKQQPH